MISSSEHWYHTWYNTSVVMYRRYRVVGTNHGHTGTIARIVDPLPDRSTLPKIEPLQ